MFSSYRIGNHLYSLIYFGRLPFRFVEGNSYHKLGLIWQKKVYTVKLQRRGSSEKNQKGETKLAEVPWTCATPLKKFNGCKCSLNHLRHKAPPWQTGRVRFRGVSGAHSWGCGSSNCSWLKGHPKLQAFKLLKNLTPIPQKPHVFFFLKAINRCRPGVRIIFYIFLWVSSHRTHGTSILACN